MKPNLAWGWPGLGTSPAVKAKENPGKLTSVAQWVGHHFTKRKVDGSIPVQGTCLGCRFGPGQGLS